MDYSEIIKEIKPSVALVLTFDSKNNPTEKGSGFVFAKKDILVTCNHVVGSRNNGEDVSIKIKFPDIDEYIDAKVVIRDEEHDLALLRFPDKDRKPIIQENEEIVKEGMPVIFPGYPLGFNLIVSQGILSSIIKDATGLKTYLIDGTVNSGNSGCPLLASNGKVIGIVNATRRVQNKLLEEVEEMKSGAVSLYGVDMIKIYQAIIKNLQLGIGYAVPCSYMPRHIELEENN